MPARLLRLMKSLYRKHSIQNINCASKAVVDSSKPKIIMRSWYDARERRRNTIATHTSGSTALLLERCPISSFIAICSRDINTRFWNARRLMQKGAAKIFIAEMSCRTPELASGPFHPCWALELLSQLCSDNIQCTLLLQVNEAGCKGRPAPSGILRTASEITTHAVSCCSRVILHRLQAPLKSCAIAE